jgi:hypothetical protein
MLLNKDTSGAHFNRVVGSDANFRFFQKLDVNFAGAKTFSPDVDFEAYTVASEGPGRRPHQPQRAAGLAQRDRGG